MFKRYFFTTQARVALVGIAIFWRACSVPNVEADDKFERGRMEGIMELVA
ncbi:MAG: hypothetical protein LAO03_13270 [Acidobacteriia bacterium]|nr:hypothetical protein [Terriglobia bacterium]